MSPETESAWTSLCGRRSATHGARGERGRVPSKLLIPRRRTPLVEKESGESRVVSFASNMFCKGVKILLIFVTVIWAESVASRAQFDLCDLNLRFEIFLSRMTRIKTLQTNCANYSNSFAKLKGKPFLCLAGGQLNDTAMEACLAEIVDGLNHFRDFFFGNNCSESCDTLKSIRNIFLNSNIFHPTKAQSPEAARAPPAAPARSLEGGLLDCGAFHLRLYVANVRRHAMSRRDAGGCREVGVTEKPRRRRKKQRWRGGKKQRRGGKERRGKPTATGDDAGGASGEARGMRRKTKRQRHRDVEPTRARAGPHLEQRADGVGVTESSLSGGAAVSALRYEPGEPKFVPSSRPTAASDDCLTGSGHPLGRLGLK
ncbi:uncharacterized protein LOC116948565 [Petromyzon marinus]|uniref:uncharacterized protein LOC116948565 n=1 Tax=Petromyzon marinus TaxID=7757 RepID=UPI003F727C31